MKTSPIFWVTNTVGDESTKLQGGVEGWVHGAPSSDDDETMTPREKTMLKAPS